MKKLLALVLCMIMMLSIVPMAQAADEPVTISILTSRHEEGNNEVTDLWIFKYLEYWLEQQGYNVDFELEQSHNMTERRALMLATASLPDLMITPGLTNNEIVMYGAGEGMLLDWTPYLNEESMPNLMALLKDNNDALVASTCIDGKVYGLPYIINRSYPEAAAVIPNAIRLWVNQEWLKQVNMELPTTMDGFLDMLRAFKAQIKIEGKEVYPVMENAQFLRKYLLSCLGFYGTTSTDGLKVMIKDDEIVVPAYTEEYKEYVRLLNVMYTEGLISPDYLTMDTTTAQGYMAEGVCGVIGNWSLGSIGDDFAKWVHLLPLTTEYCDKPVSSLDTTYKVNAMIVNAETEHADILVKMLDYLYSPEGAMYYAYGPMKGADPLGIMEGWFYDENNQMTTDSVVAGTTVANGYGHYAKQFIYPSQYAGYAAGLVVPKSIEMSGADITLRDYYVTDAITGETFNAPETVIYTRDNNAGWWRLTCADAWEKNSTTIKLPGVYMTEDDALNATDLETVLKKHVESETAKFIVGTRPIEEFEQFQKELEGMGVQEYLDLYKTAYNGYMTSLFGE